MSSPIETVLARGSHRGGRGVRTRGGSVPSQVLRSPTETPLTRGSRRGRGGVRTRGGRESSQAISEVLASYCSDLSIIVWRDANIVSMLSTYHSLQIRTRQIYDRLTYKPSVVLDYNKVMGGVDRKDQFSSAHPLERQRNRIWYKKVFRRLFNSAIFNCFVIFKSANPTISHRQFRITLAENLMKIHRDVDLTTEPRLINMKTGQMTRPTTRPKVEHRHFPVKTGFKQSRCWLCAQRKVTARTVSKCLECDINLCIEGCFMAYHT